MTNSDRQARVLRIKGGIGLAEAIAHHTTLDRGGRGPCPLCGTSRRSKALSVKDGYYFCFACGSRGDIFEWTKAIHGCTFPEALEILDPGGGDREETGKDIRKAQARTRKRGRKARIAVSTQYRLNLIQLQLRSVDTELEWLADHIADFRPWPNTERGRECARSLQELTDEYTDLQRQHHELAGVDWTNAHHTDPGFGKEMFE